MHADVTPIKAWDDSRGSDWKHVNETDDNDCLDEEQSSVCTAEERYKLKNGKRKRKGHTNCSNSSLVREIECMDTAREDYLFRTKPPSR